MTERRLMDGLAMAYAETCLLRARLEAEAKRLREAAAAIDAFLAQTRPDAETWYGVSREGEQMAGDTLDDGH